MTALFVKKGRRANAVIPPRRNAGFWRPDKLGYESRNETLQAKCSTNPPPLDHSLQNVDIANSTNSNHMRKTSLRPGMLAFACLAAEL